MPEYDVIVIGAGPSGLTAARDLRLRGHSVLILEARDRLGGRTWTTHLPGFDDQSIEVGGTYIHPKLQHNIRREIRRYAQPLSTEAGRWLQAVFHVGGKRRTFPIPPDQIVALERALLAMSAAAQRIDSNVDVSDQFLSDLDVTIDDFFAPNKLPKETRELIDGILAAVAQCDVREVSMLQWLVWIAGTGTPLGTFFSVTDEKLENGMSALWQAMAEEAKADIALDADVVAVTEQSQSVTVTTRSGQRYRSRTCIVAVGAQVLNRIEFAPKLDAARRDLIEKQYVAPGYKTFLVVENAPAGFMGYGGFTGTPDDPRIGWLYEERQLDADRILMVAWGTGVYPTLAEANKAILDYVPGAVVTATAGHDWARDAYANGINHFRRPGHALSFARTVGRTHGRVLFAGGDVTPGVWNGWIEGAVDSGRIAAEIAAELVRE